MRQLFLVPEHFRVRAGPFATQPGDHFGAFFIPQGDNTLRVIVDDGQLTGWEHVSVSIAENNNKAPNWGMMDMVKRMFWEDDEVVVQYHISGKDRINKHNGCLHLWRPTDTALPTPPKCLV